ncbi:hypothetical protein J27TS7_16080 [Paenibacillus dendritiformis]|nr:hypothetical protein J27TS7_16080 [Paenibacillus dendritiformis]
MDLKRRVALFYGLRWEPYRETCLRIINEKNILMDIDVNHAVRTLKRSDLDDIELSLLELIEEFEKNQC